MKYIFTSLIAWLGMNPVLANGVFGGSGGPPPVVDPAPPVITTPAAPIGGRSDVLAVSGAEYQQLLRDIHMNGSAMAILWGERVPVFVQNGLLYTDEANPRQIIVAP